MKLSFLLEKANIAYDGEDVEVSLITDNSAKCKPSCIFVCHKNAGRYIESAKENGAVLIISEEKLSENCIVVSDTRETYSVLCREFFSRPDEKLSLIAVTGTNGKTTVCSMINHILEMNEIKCGLIGTVTNKAVEETESELTTPDCFELYSLLSEMAEAGYEYCVIEASSQGLDQKRLFGLSFQWGIFTNLTQDHLDYHKNKENYKNAKLSLFESCKNAIINYDDKNAEEFASVCKGEVITYSVISNESVFTAKNIRSEEGFVGYEMVSDGFILRVSLSLSGDFWAGNSLAAIICANKVGIPAEKCVYALKSFSGVKGRMEILDIPTPYRVIIDYAHTPDSLLQTLLSLRKFCKGRIILVFGCGGNREKEKRSEMGRVAVYNSDVVFITSDNPRNEEPLEIIDDILYGIKKTKTPVFIQPDRRAAIGAAIKKAKRSDIILLAGKGHETCQLVAGEKIPFDEREIVKSFIK